MKNVLVVVAIAALSSAAFAQTSSPKPSATVKADAAAPSGPDLAEATAGEVIYFRYCAACHGRTLKGDGPVASGLVKPPTDLTLLAAKNGGVFPYDKVAASIDGRTTTRVHGTPDMPVWGEVFAITTGTEAPTAAAAVKRITHHVWSLQKKATPAARK